MNMPSARTHKVAEKIHQILIHDHLSLTHLEIGLDHARAAGAPVDEIQRTHALDAAGRILRGEALAPGDVNVLESVILGNGLRPAFDIRGGDFEELPTMWSELNEARDALRPIIRAVGRIDISGHPSMTFAGTGFVCGDRLLMTNRHVAELFIRASDDGASLAFCPGMSCSIDMKQEVADPSSSRIELTGEGAISMEWDLAVLRIAQTPAGVEPVHLVADEPTDADDGTAAVVGYPAFDPSESLVDQLSIFRGVFDKKRLQPGKLRGLTGVASFGHEVIALTHDCTTLGGSSGSVVIDVANRRVVGVHFAGKPAVANYCVPSWKLLNSAFLEPFRSQLAA